MKLEARKMTKKEQLEKALAVRNEKRRKFVRGVMPMINLFYSQGNQTFSDLADALNKNGVNSQYRRRWNSHAVKKVIDDNNTYDREEALRFDPHALFEELNL